MGSRAWRKPRVHLWPPSRSTSLPTTRLTSSSFPPSSERPLRNWSRARKSPRPREPVHLVASRQSRRPLSPRRLRRHPSPRRRPSRRSRRPQPKSPQQRRQLRRVQRRQPKRPHPKRNKRLFLQPDVQKDLSIYLLSSPPVKYF